MAEYVQRAGLPDDFQVICTGDWHCGSLSFHEEAAKHIVGRLCDEPDTYGLHMGDAVEGKRIDSPHFNPDGLHARYLNIGAQFEYVRELMAPAKDKWLVVGQGNHDRYLSRDVDIVRDLLCAPLGIPQGGYQTWLDLGHFRIFMFHGRHMLPRGAKDPIQREANQQAWLVNRMAPLAGNCRVMLMGHVHKLLVQPPIEQYALMAKGATVRARYFIQPDEKVRTRNPVTGKEDVRDYVPVLSRWYGITGALRRTGGFGFVDYTEVGGYPPDPIGYLEIIVRGGSVVDVQKRIV